MKNDNRRKAPIFRRLLTLGLLSILLASSSSCSNSFVPLVIEGSKLSESEAISVINSFDDTRTSAFTLYKTINVDSVFIESNDDEYWEEDYHRIIYEKEGVEGQVLSVARYKSIDDEFDADFVLDSDITVSFYQTTEGYCLVMQGTATFNIWIEGPLVAHIQMVSSYGFDGRKVSSSDKTTYWPIFRQSGVGEHYHSVSTYTWNLRD